MRRAVKTVLMASAVLAVTLASPWPLAAATPDEDRIERLEREVESLREALAEVRDASASDRVAELGRRLDVLAGEVEKLRVGEAASGPAVSEKGVGPAAAKVYRKHSGVSIGGYGEIVYERPDDTRDDGAPSGAEPNADLLRTVLYVGYKFDDRFVLNTEIEIEHGTTGEGAEEKGEVAVEFAYLDWLLRSQLNLRAGMVLMPVGFVNELHEPAVFLGVHRPEVEQAIIPSTWNEDGFGLFGDVGPLSYRTYLVTGLDASGFEAEGLREGRQHGAQATASDLAWVGRLDWGAAPGVTLGGSLYVGDAGQGLHDPDGHSVGARTTLFEGHVEWRWRGLQARALGVRARVGDAGALNRTLGLAADEGVGEQLAGYYLELGYDVLAGSPGGRALTPFARWESLDTQAEVPTGFARNPAHDRDVFTLGLSFKPIEQIVFKLDYQNLRNRADTGVDRFNVGLGYIF